MTPGMFAAEAGAWVGAAVSVGSAVIAGYKLLRKQAQDAQIIADLNAGMKEFRQRLDRQGARQDLLLLHANAPTQPVSAPQSAAQPVLPSAPPADTPAPVSGAVTGFAGIAPTTPPDEIDRSGTIFVPLVPGENATPPPSNTAVLPQATGPGVTLPSGEVVL